MKKTAIIIICCLTVTFVQSQTLAITEFGEEVRLYEDGTWNYVDGEETEVLDLSTNPNNFTKGKNSTFCIKSEKFDIGFYIDPTIWKFNKSVDNLDAEYELELKNEDLYGMIITEKVEIPLETLRMIALENGRLVAPNLQIVDEEYRIVNGVKVLFLQMDGTMSGIDFSYYGYYYSNEHGTVQFITYTSQNLLDEYRETCKDLLNGMMLLN